MILRGLAGNAAPDGNTSPMLRSRRGHQRLQRTGPYAVRQPVEGAGGQEIPPGTLRLRGEDHPLAVEKLPENLAGDRHVPTEERPPVAQQGPQGIVIGGHPGRRGARAGPVSGRAAWRVAAAWSAATTEGRAPSWVMVAARLAICGPRVQSSASKAKSSTAGRLSSASASAMARSTTSGRR